MSWDVLFAGKCEQRAEPAQRIIGLLQSLAAVSSIGDLVRVLVMKENRSASPILDLHAASLSPGRLDAATLQARLGTIPQDDIAIEGFWEVMRCFPRPGESEPSVEEYRLTLAALGERFDFPQLRPLGADLVVDAGVAKHYALSVRGEAARRNIAALLSELGQIVCCGLRTLRGLNDDRALEPETNFFCFHSILADFASDIQRPGPLSMRDLEAAARACEHIEVQAAAGGAMVFHRELIEGNLRAFYRRLRENLRLRWT